MYETFATTVLSELPADRRRPLLENWLRNLTVIDECYPGLAGALDALPAQTEIRATTAADDLQFYTTGAAGERLLLTGTAQSRARAEALRAQADDRFYLLAGAGLGAELRALYELTACPEPLLPNWRIGIYVVEPEIRHLALIFLLDDWNDVLRDPRVRWFHGAQALEDYATFLFSSDQVVAAKQMVPLSFSADREALIQGIQAIDDESARCHRDNLDQATELLAEYYGGDGWRHLQAALAGDTPLRVLGLTSRFTSFLQYCMRDLLWGFEQLGAETWLFIEPSDIHRPHPLAIAQAVAECRPDLVLVIDHFRDEFPYLPDTLPFVNWVQDLLPGITDPEWQSLTDTEFVYVFSEGFKRALGQDRRYQGLDLPVLPMGFNPDLYHPRDDVVETYDLCYVTHLMDPALTFEGLLDDRVPFELDDAERELIAHGFCDEAALMTYYRALAFELRALSLNDLSLLAHGGELVIDFFERAIERAGFRPQKALGVYFKCPDSRFARDVLLQTKLRPVRALIDADIDVRVYGRNWHRVPGLAVAARGEVANGDALNDVMNAARICLHCTGTGYHMRSVEIVAAGRFMLCRACDGDLQPITDLFAPESEVVTFRNESQLVALARRYLADPDARRAIAARARTRLVENHAYDRIARRIVDDVTARLDAPRDRIESQVGSCR